VKSETLKVGEFPVIDAATAVAALLMSTLVISTSVMSTLIIPALVSSPCRIAVQAAPPEHLPYRSQVPGLYGRRIGPVLHCRRTCGDFPLRIRVVSMTLDLGVNCRPRASLTAALLLFLLLLESLQLRRLPFQLMLCLLLPTRRLLKRRTPFLLVVRPTLCLLLRPLSIQPLLASITPLPALPRLPLPPPSPCLPSHPRLPAYP